MCTGILLRQRRAGPSSNPKPTHPTERKNGIPLRCSRVFAYGEDTHTLRLVSKLPDLRVGYVHRHPCATRGGRSAQSATYATKTKKDTPCGCPFVLEVQAGFEPADNGVADRGLTTWLLHQISNYPNIIAKFFCFVKGKRKKIFQEIVIFENG